MIYIEAERPHHNADEDMKMCKNNSITIKNPQTGNPEAIKMVGLEFVDWGFFFFVSSEMEAFKAAYYYRDRIGCKIEFSKSRGWMVTVFNAVSKKMGIVE